MTPRHANVRPTGLANPALGRLAAYLLEQHDLTALCDEVGVLADLVADGDPAAAARLSRRLRALEELLDDRGDTAAAPVAAGWRARSTLCEALRGAARQEPTRSLARAVKAMVDVIAAALAHERAAFARTGGHLRADP